VHDDLWNKLEEEELKQAQGEGVFAPIVSILKYLQCITIEADFVVEVHLHECFHRDLISATVLCLVRSTLEREVVLDWETWKGDFLVLAWAEVGEQIPSSHKDRSTGENGEKDGGLPTTTYLP
jgi:hypothetical protein